MISFWDCLQFQAKSHPTYPAIIYPKGVLEYGEYVRNAAVAANNLLASGLKPGDTVAFHCQSAELHSSLIAGAMLAGITSLSVPPRQTLPTDIKLKAIVSDLKSEASHDAQLISVTPAWLKSGDPDTHALMRSRHDGIVRVIYTSGTVGAPKAVPFTEAQLIQRVWTQIVGLRPHAGQSRAISMIGPAGGAGFTNMMMTLMTGGTFLAGLESLTAPAYLGLFGVTRIMLSPAQLAQLLQTMRTKRIDVPTLRNVVVGGGPISRQLAQRAQAELCRNIIGLYGSTEVGVVATAPADVIVASPGAVGYVVPGVQVEIIQENGRAAGPDEEGIVRIQVPGAPNRYLNDDEATKTAFRDGWFYPGDTGRLSRDGLLYVSGRQSERLNAGGVKVAPSVIECVLQEWPGVLDVAAFEHVSKDGVAEIAIAIVQDGELDQAALRKFCRERLRENTPRRWCLIKEIPRNDMGKVDRAQLQRLTTSAFQARAGGGGAGATPAP